MSETYNAKPHIRRRSDGTATVEYRVQNVKQAQLYGLIPARSSNWPLFIRESFAGAWQQNATPTRSQQNVLAFSAVYSCISLIAGDISKLRLCLDRWNQAQEIWIDVNALNVHGLAREARIVSLLDKPNGYQTRIQFVMGWLCSKLTWGNAYVLKRRDRDGNVTALLVLDPCLVVPLVAPNGEVYYQLGRDLLAGVPDGGGVVPASEIIHDRMNCLYHPLVGMSPIFACASSAVQGTSIQSNASKFFDNMSRPSGVLTAPGAISDETATRIKTAWETGFQAGNIGRVAVVGDGLKYEAMTIPANDAQLIEQLDWTARDVARAFLVPPYKIGLEESLTGANLAQLEQEYYSQCLQPYIEAIQLLLDNGLDLPAELRTEIEIDGLFRMDPLGQAEVTAKRLGSGELAPNEARQARNLKPVAGGESPYLQEQNYNLGALAKRDAKADPFAKTPAAPAMPPAIEPPKAPAEATARELADAIVAKFARYGT